MQTILVCDDDKEIVDAIDIYLTGEGFHILKAYDGYDALKILETEHADLMIIDVQMITCPNHLTRWSWLPASNPSFAAIHSSAT